MQRKCRMIIVRAESDMGEKFWGMGDTVADAVENLAEVCEDLDFFQMTFFDAKQITVEKRVKYKVLG